MLKIIIIILVLCIVVALLHSKDTEGRNDVHKSTPVTVTVTRIEKPAPKPKTNTACNLPSAKCLFYPVSLPTFEDIDKNEHADNRALIYAVCNTDAGRKRPFSVEELNAGDFKTKNTAYRLLKKKGYVEPLTKAEEIEHTLLKDEIIAALLERGYSSKGRKQKLAELLASTDYKIDRRKSGQLFKFTDAGKQTIEEHGRDRQDAIRRAITALKEFNYQGAIDAYRDYDKKWGFAHASGKKHTIFAHYDVSMEQFGFITSYPFWGVRNSDDYKKTLRGCLLAGLMRGCQERYVLRYEVEAICSEKFDYPGLLSIFDYDKEVIDNMRGQIEFDPGSALEYYISHVLYLSRQ